MKNPCVIGLDYGTDSVRAVLLDALSGKELASSVFWYPRWKEQKYCNASVNQFRQHPLDHIEGLENTIKQVVETSGVRPEQVKAICIDTTGSSPLPLDKNGVSLALTPGFEHNPNAMMVLWKDHTAIKEAEKINEISRSWGGVDYTKYVGGIYSSEWFWAKILHIISEDEDVKKSAYTWIEHCDYLTYLLIENKNLAEFKRSRCAAGHKAMWSEEWGGLPGEDFLNLLHPELGRIRNRLYDQTYTSDQIAGNLSVEWAGKLGLTTDTIIAVGTFDAHAGAIGVGLGPNTLVRVMGTSTCDIMVGESAKIGQRTIKGICGQVDGSVIPGMIGLEAGQSGFGDVLAWWKEILMWPVDHVFMKSETLSLTEKEKIRQEISDGLIDELTRQAQSIPIQESIPVALDWVNGRRTPDADQNLKAAISFVSLGTKAPHIFKALIYAICFGSKKIVDRFEDEGVMIENIIGIGGVARKSPYIMQLLADTLNKPIHVAQSDYAPALGACIYAAVASGLYTDVISAGKILGSQVEASYIPNQENVTHMEKYKHEYEVLATFVESHISKKVRS